MHWLRLIGVLLIVALLQATVVPALEVRGARPDLMLLVALYVAVREPLERHWRWNAFWVGWIAGLMVDVYSSGSDVPLGTTALVFGILAVVMGRIGADLFLDSVVARVIVVAPACLLAHAALGLALAVATGTSVWRVPGAALGAACYTAVVAPLVFAAMRPLERFLGVRSRRSFGRA